MNLGLCVRFKLRSFLFYTFFTFLVLGAGNFALAANLLSVYGTFINEDTSRHVVLNFLLKENEGLSLHISSASAGDQKSAQISSLKDSSDSLKKLGIVKSFLIEGLNPDRLYDLEITVGDEVYQYKYKTLPAKGSIQILQGGDMGSGKEISRVARPSLAKNPDVILIGGDIAYDNGDINNFVLWSKWMKEMNEVMITKEKRIIPLILAIGNHEVSKQKAPYFDGLFPQGGKTFFKRNLSDHTVLLVLDTGHKVKHEDQVDWMRREFKDIEDQWKENLKKDKNAKKKHTLALYHAPLYPSHREFEGSWSQLGRQHWLPVFDQYGLTLGLENHDHALKRTYPLKEGKRVKPNQGTVYIGDGCWGVGPRSVDKKSRNYLQVAVSVRHLWNLNISKNKILGEALFVKEKSSEDKTELIKMEDSFEILP